MSSRDRAHQFVLLLLSCENHVSPKNQSEENSPVVTDDLFIQFKIDFYNKTQEIT